MSLSSPVGMPTTPVGEHDAPEDQLISSTRRFWSRFFANKVAVVGLAFIAAMAVIAIFAGQLAPHSETDTFARVNSTPYGSHWLGTDFIGRDILSRLMYGTRASFQVSFLTVGMATLAAVPIGLIAGYFGGRVDSVIMRIMDAGFAFPPLILALTVASLLGKGSLFNMSLALAIVFVPGFVRLLRGQVLAVREETFIEASRSLGAGHFRMIRRHIFPNVASPLIVQLALALGYALLAEAGLSFIGLGVQPPGASWGGMLNQAYGQIFSASWPLIVPGVTIALTVLAFNVIADGLRDALGRERFKSES